jgi:hypothetical protein
MGSDAMHMITSWLAWVVTEVSSSYFWPANDSRADGCHQEAHHLNLCAQEPFLGCNHRVLTRHCLAPGMTALQWHSASPNRNLCSMSTKYIAEFTFVGSGIDTPSCNIHNSSSPAVCGYQLPGCVRMSSHLWGCWPRRVIYRCCRSTAARPGWSAHRPNAC